MELKATYTGDVEWGRAGTGGKRAAFAEKHGAKTYLEGLLRADAAKARNLAAHADVYLLLVITHVLDLVPYELTEVKYREQLKEVADLDAAERTLESYLGPLGPVERVRLGEGKWYDLRTRVEAWLYGPVEMPDKQQPAALDVNPKQNWNPRVQ